MKRVQRAEVQELMDRADVAPPQLRQGLADLRRVNRWLGGTRAALSVLMPIVTEIGEREVTVLDVATGSADIPLTLVQRARRHGLSLRVMATDCHPETLAAARAQVLAREISREVEVAAADALALPYGAREFHIAMCNTALHHFDPADATRLLGELARVASRAIVVTDLERSRAGLAGVRLAAATLWRRHPVTRHDSVVSLRSAYTAAEAARLARDAGLQEVRVRRHPWFRFSLAAKPRGSG